MLFPEKEYTPHKRILLSIRGNYAKCNGKADKTLDGIPISLGQVQHRQIRQQWLRAVAQNDHSCYNRDQEQYIQQEGVGYTKAKFTDIADITKFQGHYSPLDTDQQMNSASSQQVKGDTIVKSNTPIHVMPIPQTQELSDPNDGPHYSTQIF